MNVLKSEVHRVEGIKISAAVSRKSMTSSRRRKYLRIKKTSICIKTITSLYCKSFKVDDELLLFKTLIHVYVNLPPQIDQVDGIPEFYGIK